MTKYGCLSLVLALSGSALGCSDEPTSTTVPGNITDGTTNDDAGATNGGGAGADTNASGGTGSTNTTNGSSDPNDRDGDGFTPEQGDCEDGSSDINPGAFDYPGNDFDEDCDGVKAMPDDPQCDLGLAMDSTDAMDAAKAIGLCKTATADGKNWGVIEAKFVRADGTGTIEDSKMVGLLPGLGAAQVRQGSTLLALSTGVARAPDQPDYTRECDTFGGETCLIPGICIPALPEAQTAPAGFPKGSESCKDQMVGGPETEAFNGVALELKVRVPTNAKGFAFDSIFYSYEYPNFLCQKFNDFFIVVKEPKPELVPDGNVLFDSNEEPIGVNTGLLQVCDPAALPSPSPKQVTCSQGTALLAGTGFGAGESDCSGTFGPGQGGASTGWLNTTAPVFRGEVITLRFSIWDAGDAVLDSTALIDNFVWSVNVPVIETKPILQ